MFILVIIFKTITQLNSIKIPTAMGVSIVFINYFML